jgi:hypothetical protein
MFNWKVAIAWDFLSRSTALRVRGAFSEKNGPEHLRRSGPLPFAEAGKSRN